MISTTAGSTPRRSATICAIVVSRPWPCGEVPLNTVTEPDGCTRTTADSQKPAWMPTPPGPTAREGAPAGADNAGGREAADLHVGREADAAVDPALAKVLLLARECVEVEH